MYEGYFKIIHSRKFHQGMYSTVSKSYNFLGWLILFYSWTDHEKRIRIYSNSLPNGHIWYFRNKFSQMTLFKKNPVFLKKKNPFFYIFYHVLIEIKNIDFFPIKKYRTRFKTMSDFAANQTFNQCLKEIWLNIVA